MLCINCKQTKSSADSHILCFRFCGCSQSTPCSRSAGWASEIWEEISHFPSRISANLEQVQGSLPSKQQDKRIKFKQLNPEPAPLRLRGPRVAGTVPCNVSLTRGLRPAPSDASRREARQGAPANPCSFEISEPRYPPGYRTPYRYVNSAAYNMAARFPSDVSVPSFQASWQDGSDQGAFYWPYFYPWVLGMAIAGMDIIPALTFQMLPVMKKTVREKSRECHNHKPQPFPDPKRKRKPTNPKKHKPKKRTKSTKISSLFPKRGNRNTKRTEKHKNKMTHGKTYSKSPRRINHKATKSKTNTGTTALERSAEKTTGGFKALLQLADFTLGPDATLNTEIHKNSVRIKAPNSVNASKRKHKNQINHYNKQR